MRRGVLVDRAPSTRFVTLTRAAPTSSPRPAESWVRARLDRSFTIADLARALGTSPRTLTRRLAAAIALSPIRFVQRIRVEHAAHLLETTNYGVDEIARRVGYDNASTLRRVLRREMAQSASEIRQRGATARGRPPRPTPRASAR